MRRYFLTFSSSLTLVFASGATAQDIVVPSGVTLNTPQVINGVGESVLVEEGGAVDVSAINADAIRGTASDQTINNEGTLDAGDDAIRTDGNAAQITNSGNARGFRHAIRATGDGLTIVNTGRAVGTTSHAIRSDGANADISNSGELISDIHGVRAEGTGATVTNSGSVVANENGLYALSSGATVLNSGTVDAGVNGLRADGANSVVTNEGTVVSGSADGIDADGANAAITNSGAITGGNNGISSTGTNAEISNSGEVESLFLHAIRTDGQNAEVVNTGTLTGNVHGIRTSGNNSSVTNTGNISGQSAGIAVFDGTDITVVNSGKITGGNFAVFVDGSASNTTLVLGAGSVLDGAVEFGSASTLDVQNGLNLALSYQGLEPTVDTNLPVLRDTANNLIYTVDPTGFALSETYLQSTAGAIHEAVRRGANSGTLKRLPNSTSARGRNTWVAGYGGYASQDGSGSLTGGQVAYGGILGGAGFGTQDRHHGVYLGGSFAAQETDNNTQQIDTRSVYAGVYLDRTFGGTWVNVSSLIGYSWFSSDRTVASNASVGGVETASADYDGVFFSPSVTFGRALSDRTEASLGGYYAGLFLDGYNESGSSANLDVDSRNVHVAAVRAQVKHLAYDGSTQNGPMTVEIWAGVDGQFNLGNSDVDGSLNRLPLAFDASFSDSTAVGFLGAGFNHGTANSRWTVNGSIEGRYGTDDYSEIRANLAAVMRF